MDVCLVDTDVLIWFLRGQEETVDLLSRVMEECELAVSVISRTEVLIGMKDKESKATLGLLNSLTSYPVTNAVADLAAEVVRKWSRKGKTVAIPDALIAATVLTGDLALLTYNRKHFAMLEERFFLPKIR